VIHHLACYRIASNKTNRRAVNRRASQNKSSGLRGGVTHLKGRQILLIASSNASGVVTIINQKLDPLTVGDRPAVLAGIFERYKIVKMVLRWRSSVPTTVGGHIYAGVHDDANSTSTTVTTADQVLNLRTSNSSDAFKDFTLNYVPVDQDKWYYVQAESSNSDPRFITQSTLYLVSSPLVAVGGTWDSLPVGEIDVTYHYVFDGATIVAD